MKQKIDWKNTAYKGFGLLMWMMNLVFVVGFFKAVDIGDMVLSTVMAFGFIWTRLEFVNIELRYDLYQLEKKVMNMENGKANISLKTRD